MEIQVKVINVEKTTATSAKGTSYGKLLVDHKDLTTGKVNQKTLVSFANKDVYQVFSDSKNGDVFDVENVKDGANWNWVKATPVAPGQVKEETKATSFSVGKTTSTYETPEERAKKQVYIVKQSSLSNAIAFMGDINTVSVETILETAQRFTDWVFDSKVNKGNTVPFHDMESDVD